MHRHLRFKMLIYSLLINKDDFRDVDGFEKSYSLSVIFLVFFSSRHPPRPSFFSCHVTLTIFPIFFQRFFVLLLSACGNI